MSETDSSSASSSEITGSNVKTSVKHSYKKTVFSGKVRHSKGHQCFQSKRTVKKDNTKGHHRNSKSERSRSRWDREAKPHTEKSDTSTSESEVSASSSNYNPIKVLYSKKTKVPVENAPIFNTIQQFVSSLENKEIFPVGSNDAVKAREEEKQKLRDETEKLLIEKNQARFAQYRDTFPTRKVRKARNVLTRIESIKGPLGALKECVDGRIRIKVTTRNERGIRGTLDATLVAFDKQWNLALSDVVEEWIRKAPKKRKIPPALGTPVPKGTASKISPVPQITETSLGKGLWKCTRHLPQILVRGEHVVLVNILER